MAKLNRYSLSKVIAFISKRVQLENNRLVPKLKIKVFEDRRNQGDLKLVNIP